MFSEISYNIIRDSLIRFRSVISRNIFKSFSLESRAHSPMKSTIKLLIYI